MSNFLISIAKPTPWPHSYNAIHLANKYFASNILYL